MTVGELIYELESFLSEDRKRRYKQRVFINDGYDIYDYSINSVYYRNGEVVLQSNETDNGNWDLIAPYVLHCLKFFKKDLTVCIQVSDEDLDYEYFDTIKCDVEGFEKFVIACESR